MELLQDMLNSGCEGNTSWFQNRQDKLKELIISTNPKNLLEIGFNVGHSALLICETISQLKKQDGTIGNKKVNFYIFDICICEVTKYNFNILKQKYSEYLDLYLIEGDSTETVPVFLEKNPIFFDFIEVDGCHTYNCVRKDISNVVDRLTDSGIIYVDDYNSNIFPIKEVDDGVDSFDWINYETNNIDGVFWAKKSKGNPNYTSSNSIRNLQVYYLTYESKRDYYNFWNELICELKKYHVVKENKLNKTENFVHLKKKEKISLEIKSCDFVIEDINSGEFWILSNCDQFSSCILDEKDNPFLKKVLFSQYVPDQIVHHVGKNFHKFEPWIYFCFDEFNIDEFFLKRKSKEKLIPKLFFAGDERSRPILENIDSSIFDRPNSKEYIEYIDSIIEYRIGLSIGGAAVGDICYRDIEYMALGIPFIKFNYVATLNPPLIPNYHYISVPFEDLPKHNGVFKDRLGLQKHGKLIEQRFNEVIDNENLLEFVSANSKSYYEKFLSKKNRANYTLELLGLKNDLKNVLKNQKIQQKMESNHKTTLVTGLWNIRRESLSEGWSRTYEHYLQKFEQLLSISNNLIVFGDFELKKFVEERRDSKNTLFILRDTEWFKNNGYYNFIQQIRQNPKWLEQSTWLPDSTQAKLEFYNPLVMSKMFLLHDAKIMDPFDSEHMFWIDAGLFNTVHPGYFTHDRVQDKLSKHFHKFGFVCFPYKANTEIHGFSYPKINEYAGDDVKLVSRGGFFGGPKSSISEVNSIYYQTLMTTLQDGYMGTEESIFSILLYKHQQIFQFYEIEENGLLGKFFEDLKEDKLQKGYLSKNSIPLIDLDTENTGLYVIGFNSPSQFQTLIQSMMDYDPDFIRKPIKILLDNSTDSSTTPEYEKLCLEYGFSHVKMDNLGICGGRQWIAEDASERGFDFYFFFEDDMFFYPKEGERCRNGFNRFVSGLYQKSLEIIKENNFDFLKLNYSEFFGDNGTQWSWYNVPQNIREKFFPEKPNLPKIGQDPNAPKTEYKNIRSHKGIPYVNGDIYYCNWPQIVSKTGNQKMFLNTKWASPYEQTWMSYMFQETKSGNLYPGLLLLTPTEHNRFEHYDGKLRKES